MNNEDLIICNTSFTEDGNEYKTVFEGELSNIESQLQCTLLTFSSIYESDPYLEHFKDFEKESIDDFLC